MPNDMPQTKPARGFQGRSVGTLLARIVTPVMRKRGFRDIDVWTHWPVIVGPQLAAFSMPERISRRNTQGAVLTVKVEGAMALEVQHMAPLILERLNRHYGAGSITKIAIIQGPLPAKKQYRLQKPSSNEELVRAEAALGPFPDGPLKAALARLGARVKDGGKK